MSLIPRRGLGRHGQPGAVAVHPGWTLSPTSVTEAASAQPSTARHAEQATVQDSVPQQAGSRWTSTPAVPPLPTADTVTRRTQPLVEPLTEPVTEPVTEALAEPVHAPLAAVAAAVVAATSFPVGVESVAGELLGVKPAAPINSWASEWEAVAATPAAPGAPLSLHTAAAAALDAVFGKASVTAAWTAAPADLVEQPHPAPLVQPHLTELDVPSKPSDDLALTPILAALTAPAAQPVPQVVPQSRPQSMPQQVAVQPAAEPPAVPHAVFAQASSGVVAPPAAPQLAAWPNTPPPSGPPPTSPPPSRRPVVPPSAQRLLERAIRSAPSAPVQRRSTVRLGFADASVVDLRPDDPIAKALHTVAAALIGRDRN